MKKALNLATLIVLTFVMSGCWSWQKIVSFGYWQSDDERLAQRAQNDQDALKTSCEAGKIVACNNLAVNFSTLKNFNDAKIYYEKACEKGLATACSNLGQIYEQGLVDERKDTGKALELYKFACNAGDDVGCYNEALLTYSVAQNKQGSNKEKSERASLSLLAKSCELEYAQACYPLAKLTGNEAQAKKLYERACKLGKCVE